MSYTPRANLKSSFQSKPKVQSPKQLRFLLYSHDSVGLGHLRRNLAIAGQLSTSFPGANVLIMTGSPCATQFSLPANTDLIKIPSIYKNSEGAYETLNFSGSLHKTLEFRSRMILETLRSFGPHLLIMDHQLAGLKGEGRDMLWEAKKRGILTLYGLRDVKDSPKVVVRHWDNAENRKILNEVYDCVCVYGTKDVFDPVESYAPMLNDVKRLEYTGYIVSPVSQSHENPSEAKRKKVLVTFGGGSDGEQRAHRYLDALAGREVEWDSDIYTGPLMDASVRQQIRNRANKIQPIGSVKVHGFHPDFPALLQTADAVVSMAGYNSCAEILQSGVPAVLLPRSFPRKEQLIRATRIAELGWVSVMPKENPDPRTLFGKVEAALEMPRQHHTEADLGGLERLSEIVTELLADAGLLSDFSHTDIQSNKEV